MVKIYEDKYPMGSLPNQKSPGRYIHATLYENLKFLARNATKDMTYMGVIFSSTYEVGTGKSTLAQHIAEAYHHLLREYHNLNIDLTMNHIVFNPKDLITRAFEVPEYSCVIVDEWEDAHYWSALGMSLRQFFRKCRQLHLFILIIIPNYFQFPKPYAISRSIFAIDVKFLGEFERGHFDFYNFERKKDLYVKGKKTENYTVVQCNFKGNFTNGYVVNRKEYEEAKRKDMKSDSGETQHLTETQVKALSIYEIVKQQPKIDIQNLCACLSISKHSYYRVARMFEKEPRVTEINRENPKSEIEKGRAIIMKEIKKQRESDEETETASKEEVN